jgi:hypothetical protein
VQSAAAVQPRTKALDEVLAVELAPSAHAVDVRGAQAR